MLSVQILVKDHIKTIEDCLKSLKFSCPMEIFVGDLGSQDGTLKICEDFGCTIIPVSLSQGWDAVRNHFIEMSNYKWKLRIDPWERIITGHDEILSHMKSSGPLSAGIIHRGILTKDVRLWDEGKFVNQVSERLDIPGKHCPGLIFVSSGYHWKENLSIANRWVNSSPAKASPYYYRSWIHLASKDYVSFEKDANQYLFLEPENEQSVTMVRYYQAMIACYVKKDAHGAKEHIATCITNRPCMAEFWCLLGDIHYHLEDKYSHAKHFYENAIIMGSQRKAEDTYPLEIAKYDEYPRKMMESCEKLQKTKSSSLTTTVT